MTGHCVCRDDWTCPWCATAIDHAETEREHGDSPVDLWDADAAAADMVFGGGR